MNTYIALFRGINVGGKSILRMKDLKVLLEDPGLQSVKTYIQSGNVVFRSEDRSATQLAGEIGEAIRRKRGFEPHVLLLEKEEMKSAMAANPFPAAESEPKSLHLYFLAAVPDHPDVKELESFRKESERFVLDGNVFYLHAPDGIGRSKLAARAERLIGVPMTGRNWRTVCKIMTLAEN